MALGFRRALLLTAKWSGLFHLCRFAFRNRLVILCFHGFSFADEHRFRPKLYMKSETVLARLRWLRERGYQGIPLDHGLEKLRAGNLPAYSVAITIDDGWRSTAVWGPAVFAEWGVQPTIYVTSYYVEAARPVFDVLLQYLFWRTERTEVRLDGILPGVESNQPTKGAESERVIARIVEYAQKHLDLEARYRLARLLAARLEVSYDEIVSTGKFSLMSADQIAELSRSGFDIQLHTHGHELPSDASGIARELADNRASLEPIVGKRLVHFCYPSGLWSTKQWPELGLAGIESATTCDPGLNGRHTHRYGLRRILDAEDMDVLEFEAEIVGFKHMVRRAVQLGRGQ